MISKNQQEITGINLDWKFPHNDYKLQQYSTVTNPSHLSHWSYVRMCTSWLHHLIIVLVACVHLLYKMLNNLKSIHNQCDWSYACTCVLANSTKHSRANTFAVFMVFAWTANFFLPIFNCFGTCGCHFDAKVKVFPWILTWLPNCKSFVPQKFCTIWYVLYWFVFYMHQTAYACTWFTVS